MRSSIPSVLFFAGIVLVVACVGDDPANVTPTPEGGASSSSGNASSSSGDSSDAAAEACKDTCDGKCVDLQNDPLNCGGCAKACTSAKVKSCVAGKCGSEIVKVSMGTYDACIVLRDGSVWCWGDRSAGVIGLAASGLSTAVPTKIDGLTNIVDISVGHEHACAIDSNGDVWCWGANTYEQTGSPGTANECMPNTFCHVPRKVPLNGVKAAQISAGSQTNCIRSVGATANAGDVYCWGRNASKLISAADGGVDTGTKPPTKIASFAADVVDVSVSMDDTLSAPRVHACAVRTSGQVWCWGANQRGQLGRVPGGNTCKRGGNDITCEPTPLAALETGQGSTPFTGAKSVRAMIDATCVVKDADKSIWCWGSREAGQTGIGLDGVSHPEPTAVGIADPVALFEARGYTAWHVNGAGAVKGWGITDYFDVGLASAGTGCIGTFKCIQTPTDVPGLAGVTQIGGGLHSSAAMRAGVPLAWGRNTQAQLGHATAAPGSGDVACPTGAPSDYCNGPAPVGDLP